MSRRCRLLALDRIEDLVDGPPPAGVDVRPVAEGEVGRVRDFRNEGMECHLLLNVLAGDPTVFAWHDGRVVGHFTSILARRAPKRLATGVDLAAGEALLDHGNVREDLRGRGVFQAMIRALTKRLFEEPEIRRVVSDVPLDQPASLAAHEKCGFRVVGELRYLRVFNVVLRRKLTPVA